MRQLLLAGVLAVTAICGTLGLSQRGEEDPERVIVSLFDGRTLRDRPLAVWPDGLQTADYSLNPIVLLQHRMEPDAVIGRAIRLWQVDDTWFAELEFTQDGAKWAHLLEWGVMGVSVHLDSMVVAGNCAISSNLVEISVVTVGAYPNAVPVDRPPIPVKID